MRSGPSTSLATTLTVPIGTNETPTFAFFANTEATIPFDPAVNRIFVRFTAIPLTPEEAASVKPFYLGLLDGHRILVDREEFLRGILARLERRLAELGSKRLTDERGNPYWDLKPDYVLGEDVVL